MNVIKHAEQEKFGFGFESPNKGDKDIWLTPPRLIQSLGVFDLDPCFLPDNERPWDTAKKHYCEADNGLLQPWAGRVWANPPYGPQTGLWLKKLAEHGNGVALVFARTETTWFQGVAGAASGFLFLNKRLKFHHANGMRGQCATAPSVLISFDNEESEGVNALSLKLSTYEGVRFGPCQKLLGE